MLIGLAVAGASSGAGISALLFYLAAYGLMTLGVFALLAALESNRAVMQTQADLAGLSRSHPAAALAMAVCLFSLTGLPPTAGFMGKLNLFFASWSEGTNLGRVLAIALALNAAVSAWYYLRLIAVMYLEPPQPGEPRKVLLAPAIAGAACTVGTVLLFLQPQALWDVVARFVP
jgi:NADH-quinone oxidoreductase subunit N